MVRSPVTRVTKSREPSSVFVDITISETTFNRGVSSSDPSGEGRGPYYTTLYYTIPYHTILYHTILYYINITCYIMIYCTLSKCIMLCSFTILCHNILHYFILYHTIPSKKLGALKGNPWNPTPGGAAVGSLSAADRLGGAAGSVYHLKGPKDPNMGYLGCLYLESHFLCTHSI